jgi:hypothetical protein
VVPEISGPAAVFNSVLHAAAEQVAIVVKPGAAAAVAVGFTFPLALMVLVVLFLIIQPRMDRRDPKLRTARAAGDADVPFEVEEEL